MKIILVLLILTLVTSSEVDTLNLLLPQLTQTAFELPKQLLSTKGGCYHWSSSSPDILQVTPHQPASSGCSRQALVQVAEPGPFPSSVYVSATDTATQSILNIPARIRKINQIHIATKSRMMNIKQIQKLELYGHDAQENTFTSLEGLRFSWTLVQNSQIIDIVSISQARLLLPLKTRQIIQKKGFQSDILVVRALAPGNLKIIAKCIEPGYEHLSNQITLSVHERFELKPGSVLLMSPNASYQLNLMRPSLELIKLPQSYYNIISCPEFTINQTLYLTVPGYPSQCEIKVEDTRTKPPYYSVVNVIVEHPDQIKIISEGIVIVGKQSNFQVKLYHKQKLLYGEPYSLKISSTFQINTNRRVILASNKMAGSITATLNELTASKDITANLPVRAILPSNYIHLPVEQIFKLKVLGGSGIYDYIVSSQIAHVSTLGIISCKKIGQANLTVIDRTHPANRVVIRLKISDIGLIQSLQKQKEVNKEEWGYVYVLGKSKNGEYFTQCLASQFSYTISAIKLEIEKKVNFYNEIRELATNPSRLVQQTISESSLLKNRHMQLIRQYELYVTANEIGKQQLQTYIVNLQNYGICEVIRFRSLLALQEISIISSNEYDITTKLPLRVYESLQTTISSDQTHFLMTPESSLQWSYEGGSYLWPSSQLQLTLNGKQQTDKSAVVISCPSQQTTSTQYDLILANKQTKTLLFPTSQTTTLFITCQYPKKLEVHLEHGDFFEELLIAPKTDVSGQVESFDGLGQVFYNASNVVYHFTAQTGVISGKTHQFKYSSKGINDVVTIFSEKLKSGLGFRRVELLFKTSIAQPLAIDHLLYHKSESEPTTNMTKYIRNIILFNPNKAYIFTFRHASPLLYFKCSGSIECSQHEGGLTMRMLRQGRGEVMIKDKRVYGSTQWLYDFIIVSPEDLTIQVDRNYVQQGQNIKFTVYNIFQGTIISPLLYQPNHLHLALPGQLKLIKQEGNIFTVQTQADGVYSVYAEQDYPTQRRSRVPAKVNVYEKISIDMSNIVQRKEDHVMIIEGQTILVAGCRRIICIKGGPSNMKVNFEAERGLKTTEKSERTYELTSKTKGTYLATFKISNNEQQIAMIKVKIEVNSVNSLELMSISSPIVGAQFRILPRFRIGQSTVQGCICDFEYKWSVLNGLIQLGSSVTFGYLAGGGVNASALSPGNEVVSLQVKDKYSYTEIVSSQKIFEILSDCSQNLPSVIGGQTIYSNSMLLPPLSGYQFPHDNEVIAIGDLLRVGYDKRQVESSRKVGEGALKVIKKNCLAEIIGVQIIDIAGAMISNQHGFVSLAPHSEINLPFYLIDKHGRIFVSPLTKLEYLVVSSNPEVLAVSLAANGKEVKLTAQSVGTCLLSFSVVGYSIIDQITVSVGSKILPTFEVQIIKGGYVKYSLPNAGVPSWSVQNTKIAEIDSKTGLLRALSQGRTKVSSNEVFGWVNVKQIKRFEQVGKIEYKSGSPQITFRAIWQGSLGEEEIPHFTTNSNVNNNLDVKCVVEDTNSFKTVSSIVTIDGKQRLLCKVGKLTNAMISSNPTVIHIKDSHGITMGTFTLRFDFGFTIDPPKKIIELSKDNARIKITVLSTKKVKVLQKGGQSKYVSETYNVEQGKQQINIDMSGCQENQRWQLAFQQDSQRQVVTVHYTAENKGKDSHSFWSFELDWPDYLIILMAVIFAGVCVLQYFNQNKLKYA